MDLDQTVRQIMRRCPPVAYLFVPVIRLKDRLQSGQMHKDMETCCTQYCTASQRGNRAYMRRTRWDMWYSFLRYHCPFDEYFLFHFQRLSPMARHEFVTDYEKVAVCDKLSPVTVRDIFANKGNTYLRFAPYYKREAFIVNKAADFQAFSRFAASHSRYIVKPFGESCGRGVRIVEGGDTETLFRQYQDEGVILEELIRQDEALARFHPGSVNTVRCATFLKDGTPHILFTFLRLGRGNSIVDNGGAGGLFVNVDIETGILTSPGMAEDGFSAIIHPDTGVQILGAVIPRWEEMKALATELALQCPELPYISWDLALTPDGWVLVEGNSLGQFIGPQLTRQKGMRKQLSRYFDLDP